MVHDSILLIAIFLVIGKGKFSLFQVVAQPEVLASVLEEDPGAAVSL